MSQTIKTPTDTATEAEEFLHLDPADITIGTNVRTDLRPDHKEFRKSIKERGVLEAVTVNAAMAVTKAEQTRNRLDSGDLTLEEAAIFAEHEHDPDAVERLENAKRWRRSLTHEAQRLRDEAVEREADAAEVERLRAEDLPVLTAEEVAEAQESSEVLRIERLVTAEGEPLPEEEWPNVPGARVQVVKEWVYPEDEYDDTAEDEATEQDDEECEPAEPYQRYMPVWVVTDLDASGLRRRGQTGASGTGSTSDDGESEEQAEARREERRRVIANNKAWDSVLLTALQAPP